ncbi:hypothetical protein TL16_g10198 [Triparma laevis f. inornata]|uniref:Maf-like protein n=1 Tax=Triparma laevis f. inornata TaxID=1714386 RepID=A0A9W7BCU8_9STRA|nr:hypothetical protein TL16_g10198 [Triparma laevis f. inornata]
MNEHESCDGVSVGSGGPLACVSALVGCGFGLLTMAQIPFTKIVSPFDEAEIRPHKNSMGAAAYVSLSASKKASSIILPPSLSSSPVLVIGSDTVVVHDSKILEKPTSNEEAFAMLTSLSSQTHSVYTGVSLHLLNIPSPITKTFHSTTSVKFSPLTPSDISSYIQTGEPMDKAGSYGIQGIGGQFVESINGCYFNVMGLPINRVCKLISEMAKEIE